MKKIVNFFAMAAFVVALSSCGNKTAESTESTTDSMSTMESTTPAPDTTMNTMSADTTAHMSADTAAH